MWRGAESLKSLCVALDTLKEDDNNARAHGKRNAEAIRRSLERFGQQKPVVVTNDNTIVAGNGTLQAARQLGWTELAVARTTLSEHEARAYAIADNKTSDLSEWNYENLASQLQSLDNADDLAATGFADYELAPLLANDWAKPEASDDYEPPPPRSLGTHAKGSTVHFHYEEYRLVNEAIDKYRREQDAAELTPSQVIVRWAKTYAAND